MKGLGGSSPSKKAFTDQALARIACTAPERIAEEALRGEKTWPLLVAGILGERTKSQALLAQANALFPHATGNPDMESKLAAATAKVASDSVTFQNRLRDELYVNVPQWPLGLLADTKNLARLNVARGKSEWARMQAWLALHRFLTAVTPWLDPTALPPDLEYTLCLAVKDERELRQAFHAALCADGHLPLALGRIKLPDTHSFWPQLFELFVNEDYAFDAGTDSPHIIDAGMHMGLATYYFKAKYPQARIIAFEPSPKLRAIAEENVRTCGFTDVHVEPYALSGTDGDIQFYVDAEDTMAGSISAADGKQPITVATRRLSPYLDQPVDYLKLDIEGAEGAVLAECLPVLHRVHHLFIEYHETHHPEHNSLPAILSLLDRAGFEYEVSKSHGYHLISEHRPMAHVGQSYSAILWAKNRTWPPAETA